ncbi:hypothetical protein PENTCL1PPCAC_5171, partial [Pristionchus entomophagus]
FSQRNTSLSPLHKNVRTGVFYSLIITILDVIRVLTAQRTIDDGELDQLSPLVLVVRGRQQLGHRSHAATQLGLGGDLGHVGGVDEHVQWIDEMLPAGVVEQTRLAHRVLQRSAAADEDVAVRLALDLLHTDAARAQDASDEVASGVVGDGDLLLNGDAALEWVAVRADERRTAPLDGEDVVVVGERARRHRRERVALQRGDCGGGRRGVVLVVMHEGYGRRRHAGRLRRSRRLRGYGRTAWVQHAPDAVDLLVEQAERVRVGAGERVQLAHVLQFLIQVRGAVLDDVTAGGGVLQESVGGGDHGWLVSEAL